MADIKSENVAQDSVKTNIGHENDSAGRDPAEVVWDEERLEKAMETLKDIYIQLRGLRTSIPRLVAPLTVKQPSPEILFKKFAAAASTANEEMKRFAQLMEDDNTVKIFERAKESRVENPKDITPWRITQHPDWLVRNGRLRRESDEVTST